jgi:tetratricopeptide (TPR) repeat protein
MEWLPGKSFLKIKPLRDEPPNSQRVIRHKTRVLKDCLLVFLLLSSGPVISQDRFLDSMKTLIKSDREDTNKVKHLNDLGWHLSFGNPDTAILIANKTLELANKINWPAGVSNTLGQLANYNIFLSNYPKAAEYYQSALELDRKNNNPSGICHRLNGLGIVYMNQNDYAKALKYFKESLEIAERIGKKRSVGITLTNIGGIYQEQSEIPKALEYYFRALKCTQELGDRTQSSAILDKIGTVFSDQGDCPKAISYFTQALKIADSLNNKYLSSQVLANIGSAYIELKNFPKALEYSEHSLRLLKEVGRTEAIAVALGNIGTIYGEQKNYPAALKHFKMSLKLSREVNDTIYVSRTLGNIGSLYTLTGRYKEAFDTIYSALALSSRTKTIELAINNYKYLTALYDKSNVSLPDTVGGRNLSMEQMRSRALYYYKRHITLRDSANRAENKKELVKKEMNYLFEKKEAVAEAEHKKEIEKQNEIAEEKSRKQKAVILFVACGFLLILVFALFVVRSLRTTRQQKVLIESQKHLVEEKQKEIIDSINYARRIQTALLPTESYIAKTLKKMKK